MVSLSMRCLLAIWLLASGAWATRTHRHRAHHLRVRHRAHFRYREPHHDGETEDVRDHDFKATLRRMSYWAPAGPALAPTTKYLLFSPDAGGPNNVRIGMEMAAVVAQYTDRTFVLPPPTSLYLLDWGPDRKDVPATMAEGETTTLLESLMNLAQIKAALPTLTFEEFTKRTGLSWEEAQANAARIYTGEGDIECEPLSHYAQITESLLFMDGQKREGFSCGEWWARGAPREEIATQMGERGWALLDHGFVWTQSAFDIAAHVVSYMGIFKYNALHGRYGDFQFDDARTGLTGILKNWPSLLEQGSTLYISTDNPEKFKNFKHPSVRVLMWDDLFGEQTGQLLAPVKAKFGAEQWFKLQGPVEEIICTFSKLFVGTDRSSFSGHIQRMRIEADAPTKGHDVHMEPEDVDHIQTDIDQWERRDGRWSFKTPSWDVGTPFLLQLRAARHRGRNGHAPPVV